MDRHSPSPTWRRQSLANVASIDGIKVGEAGPVNWDFAHGALPGCCLTPILHCNGPDLGQHQIWQCMDLAAGREFVEPLWRMFVAMHRTADILCLSRV